MSGFDNQPCQRCVSKSGRIRELEAELGQARVRIRILEIDLNAAQTELAEWRLLAIEHRGRADNLGGELIKARQILELERGALRLSNAKAARARDIASTTGDPAGACEQIAKILEVGE